MQSRRCRLYYRGYGSIDAAAHVAQHDVSDSTTHHYLAVDAF